MKLTSYVQDLGQTILLMENELRGTLTIALNAVKQKGNEEMLKIQVRNVQREGSPSKQLRSFNIVFRSFGMFKKQMNSKVPSRCAYSYDRQHLLPGPEEKGRRKWKYTPSREV
ncbi:hypothetical protein CB1_000557007 [Camelus ferus]|nr:hypothetical protein CB1_001858005 [Camelus ferus]EPY83524.1 hypothetical protein CB1_000557007 [Camelus ferus]